MVLRAVVSVATGTGVALNPLGGVDGLPPSVIACVGCAGAVPLVGSGANVVKGVVAPAGSMPCGCTVGATSTWGACSAGKAPFATSTLMPSSWPCDSLPPPHATTNSDSSSAVTKTKRGTLERVRVISKT
jgi:hypothetical protein